MGKKTIQEHKKDFYKNQNDNYFWKKERVMSRAHEGDSGVAGNILFIDLNDRMEFALIIKLCICFMRFSVFLHKNFYK